MTELRATVLEASPLGRSDSYGTALYAIALTVDGDGAPARRTVVSAAVPEHCRHLLETGTSLPAHTVETHPDTIAIDWERATVEPMISGP